jgi:tetratricopeptide (TPR) repeat protein
MSTARLLARVRESCVANAAITTKLLLERVAAADEPPQHVAQELHRLGRELGGIGDEINFRVDQPVAAWLPSTRDVLAAAERLYELAGDGRAAAACRSDRGLATFYGRRDEHTYELAVEDISAAREMFRRSGVGLDLPRCTSLLAIVRLRGISAASARAEAGHEFAALGALEDAIREYFAAGLAYAQDGHFVSSIECYELALSLVPIADVSPAVSYEAELSLAIAYEHLDLPRHALSHLASAEAHWRYATGKPVSGECALRRVRLLEASGRSLAETLYHARQGSRGYSAQRDEFADSLYSLSHLNRSEDLPDETDLLYRAGRLHELVWTWNAGFAVGQVFHRMGLWALAVEEYATVIWNYALIAHGRAAQGLPVANEITSAIGAADESASHVQQWLGLVPEARRASEVVRRFTENKIRGAEMRRPIVDDESDGPLPEVSSHDRSVVLRLAGSLRDGVPDQASAIIEAGRALLALGEPELALDAIQVLDGMSSVDRWALARAAMLAGNANLVQDRWPQAATWFRRAAAGFREMAGDSDPNAVRALLAAKVAHVVHEDWAEAARDAMYAGGLYAQQRDYWSAMDCFDEAARLCADAADPDGAAEALAAAGEAALYAGSSHRAFAYLSSARSVLKGTGGDRLASVESNVLLARSAIAVGRYEEGDVAARAALDDIHDEDGWEQESAGAHLAIAEYLLRNERAGEALRHLHQAADVLDGVDDDLLAARHLLLMAEVHYRAGDTAAAFDAVHAALGIGQWDELSTGNAHALLARIHLDLASSEQTPGHSRLAGDYAALAHAAFDRRRYEIADPQERRRWRALSCDHLVDVIADVALAGRQYGVLAQLIEAARLQGLPSAHSRPEPSSASEVGLDDATPATVASNGEPSPAFRGRLVVTVGPRAVSDGVIDGRDRFALEDAIVGTAGAGAVWWGMWRHGARLLWNVVTADRVVEAGVVDATLVDEHVTPLRAAIERSASPAAPDLFAAAASLGPVLIPSILREMLAASSATPLSLVIAPSPDIASVPFGLLGIGTEDVRLAERAVVRLAPSVAAIRQTVLFADARSTIPRQDPLAILAVVDPAGDPVWGHRDPDADVEQPASPRGRSALPGWGTTTLTRTEYVVDSHGSHGDEPREATLSNLADALQAHPDVLLWFGHTGPVRGNDPLSHNLALADGAFTARHWYLEPRRWPAPERVALISCTSSGLTDEEGLGLGPAALAAGSRHVAATSWPIPAGHDAEQVADTLLALLSTAHDPVGAWHEHVAAELIPAHRRGSPALDPLVWASVHWLGTST